MKNNTDVILKTYIDPPIETVSLDALLLMYCVGIGFLTFICASVYFYSTRVWFKESGKLNGDKPHLGVRVKCAWSIGTSADGDGPEFEIKCEVTTSHDFLNLDA